MVGVGFHPDAMSPIWKSAATRGPILRLEAAATSYPFFAAIRSPSSR